MRAVPLNRHVVFWTIAVAGTVADLLSKHLAFSRLGMPDLQGHTYWLWPGVFGFQTSLNEGALFGLGQGMVPLFALMSVVAAGAIAWWLFWTGAARQWLLTIALGSITAGILGNLYDRLGLPGLHWNTANAYHGVGDPVFAVRDWILVMIGTWPWPTFNLADSMLVCGAALLLWQAYRTETVKDDS